MRIKSLVFPACDNVNQVRVKVYSTQGVYGHGEKLIDLPCGLSTEKTYGPTYKHYSYSEVGSESLRYLETSIKYKWEGDPEVDHIEEMFINDHDRLIVVLYQAGFQKCQDFPHPDASWLPEDEPWTLFVDDKGRMCLKLDPAITVEYVGLKKVEDLF